MGSLWSDYPTCCWLPPVVMLSLTRVATPKQRREGGVGEKGSGKPKVSGYLVPPACLHKTCRGGGTREGGHAGGWVRGNQLHAVQIAGTEETRRENPDFPCLPCVAPCQSLPPSLLTCDPLHPTDTPQRGEVWNPNSKSLCTKKSPNQDALL